MCGRHYGKKNGNVCFRCIAKKKTCRARIETTTLKTMIALTKLAMLQLLRYEFLANVELRKTFPSVRPRSFGLHYSPLSLHQLTMLRFWSCKLRFYWFYICAFVENTFAFSWQFLRFHSMPEFLLADINTNPVIISLQLHICELQLLQFNSMQLQLQILLRIVINYNWNTIIKL